MITVFCDYRTKDDSFVLRISLNVSQIIAAHIYYTRNTAFTKTTVLQSCEPQTCMKKY